MLSGSSKLARSLELESTLLRKAAGAGTTAIEKAHDAKRAGGGARAGYRPLVGVVAVGVYGFLSLSLWL